MQENLAVYVQDAVKKYGRKNVLKGLCMEVEKGQIYGLLGASGCGKSTLVNALVGRQKIDKGEMWVLGRNPGKYDRRIGYMPQEIALVSEFTVKDTIYYFGRLSNMKEGHIAQKFIELKTILELPSDDRYLKDCSGGEQRRVSLAVALLHNPQLIIMDEPTVGIESILRNRIWSYLIEISRTENVTIVLTTHYLEESRLADKIGLMREGKLLAEDTPNQLMSMFNSTTLEDVFLILSKRHEEKKLKSYDHSGHMMELEVYRRPVVDGMDKNRASDISAEILQSVFNNNSSDELEDSELPDRCCVNKKRMKALLNKNLKQFLRSFSNLVFLMVLPLIQQVIFLNSIGRDVTGIPLGIVNDEDLTSSCSENSSNIHVTVTGDIFSSSCQLHNMSCRFLDHLHHPMIEKVYYDTLNEAHESMKHGEVIGVLHISKNFTNSLEKRMDFELLEDVEVLEMSQIKVWMDYSNYRTGMLVQKKLIQLYEEFQKSLLEDCQLPLGLAKLPVNVEYIYGKKDEESIVNMIPCCLVSIMFFMGSIMTSQIIIEERRGGFWARNIVAGVTSFEMISAHFITLASIAVVQILGIFVVTYAVYQQEYHGSIFLMYVMVYLQATCGMAFGFLVSIWSTDHTMATIIVAGTCLPMNLLNGMIWPIQGMPKYLAYIAMCLPFTLTSESLRNVSKKGMTIADANVLNGIGISLSWTLFFCIMSVYFMKKRGVA